MSERQLNARFQAALVTIRTRFGAHVAAEWAKLGAYNEADLVLLVAAIEPAALAVRSRTTALTVGWLAKTAGTTAVVTSTDLAPLVLAETLRPAFMTTWGDLAKGKAYADAVQAGLDRSSSEAEFFVTNTSREAIAAVDRQSPELTRWGRFTDANACSWCDDVSYANNLDFGSAEAADIGHDHCHCSIEPV